jgi:N-acetylneuraminic acid mutarotase
MDLSGKRCLHVKMSNGYRSRFQPRFPAKRTLTVFLLFAGSACLLGIGTPPATAGKLAFSHSQGPESVRRTLTFTERAAYQFAIEEVYWRHRIWPKDNPGPKPPLDAVISREEVEKKVTDYLRKSRTLADYWQQPITAEQLQAEMDRMASHTKQPKMLGELFEALGKDPFMIAECLARPILAERLVAQFNGTASESSRAKEQLARRGGRDPVEQPLSSSTGFLGSARNEILDNATYRLPEVSVPLDCADGTWTATTTVNAPEARDSHTAVWTGSEMIIWGGFNYSSNYLNTGARYNPATDSWTATSTINAPTPRGAHAAVWTGSEMIVWGGSYSNTGGRYSPVTDSWTASSMISVPTARSSHTAVWTGSEMIIWGGYISGCCWTNTGGRYNPTTNNWAATSITNLPAARERHTAIWTGSEMIIWGGYNGGCCPLNTGGRYNPNPDSWTAAALPPDSVEARQGHTAVWTGSEMIVWGGYSSIPLITGGRYNPTTDSWMPTGFPNVSGRVDHTAVWTGSEMIIWGGQSYSNTDVNTGGRYDPGTDSWTPTTTANAPVARESHTTVWTGSEMIIWGGLNLDAGGEFNTGGSYCAQPSTPIVQSAVSRKTHGNAGSFGVDLPLSGTPGMECRSGGATGDYTIVVTFLANVSVNASPQAAVTSGIGTIGSGGVSNGGMVITSGNVVTVPLTNIANVQTINVTLNNVNGSTNVTIPMRVLIGDVNGNAAVNASDVALTKSRVGQTVDATTFRADVNANGSINASDVSLVKSKIGTGLP